MSQSIDIQGIYKDNKITCIGCFNPNNNRNFNVEEINHIHLVFENYFKNELKKFKKIVLVAHNDGKMVMNEEIPTVDHEIIDKKIEEYLTKVSK